MSQRFMPLSKTVIRLKPHAAEFLHQYSTQIPQSHQNAFIDLQGKIIAACDQANN